MPPAAKSQGDKLSILTHDCVHRTHLEIFGRYYPAVFKNWFVDDWITEVYMPWSHMLYPWKVKHHTDVHGTRYNHTNTTEGSLHLQREIATGRQKIAAWVKQHTL